MLRTTTEGNANAEEIRSNSPDTEEYVKGKKYLKGSMVKSGDKIYIAIKNVPADVELGNENYWEIFIDAPDKYQSDWEQNDETAGDYIRNRICYSEQVPARYVAITEGRIAGTYVSIDNWPLSEHLETGLTYKITTGEFTQSVIAYENSFGINLTLSGSDGSPRGNFYEQNQSGKLSWSGAPNQYFDFKIELDEPEHTVYHTIDPKFLPSNVLVVESDYGGDNIEFNDSILEMLLKGGRVYLHISGTGTALAYVSFDGWVVKPNPDGTGTLNLYTSLFFNSSIAFSNNSVMEKSYQVSSKWFS